MGVPALGAEARLPQRAGVVAAAAAVVEHGRRLVDQAMSEECLHGNREAIAGDGGAVARDVACAVLLVTWALVGTGAAMVQARLLDPVIHDPHPPPR